MKSRIESNITKWAAVIGIGAACCFTAAANTLYFQGFESDNSGWDNFGGSYNATRVPSGTHGITSASGSYHAESSASGSAGNWGGYNYGAGGGVTTTFQPYETSVDIYLNVNGGWANPTSAIRGEVTS